MPSRRRTVAERVAQRCRFLGEQAGRPFDERDLAAETADGLRHLDPDRPAAQHEQSARDGLHAGCLAVRPDPLELAQAGNGRHERVGSGGDDDVVGRVAHAVDLDHPDAGEPAGAAQQVDAVVRQPALLPGVGVVRDLEVAPGEDCFDVDLRRRCSVPCRVHGLAGAQQRLGRDAGPVGALAADELPLDEGDAQPALGERAGAVLTGRAAADDDDVVVAHVGSSVPACSATMYSAYQSGQFTSYSPPSRFSCSP